MRFKHYLNELNVLVYDTLYGNPEDVLYALNNLKPATEEKLVILISHLGVWGNSGLKEKREVENTEPVEPDQANNDANDNPDDVKDQDASAEKEVVPKLQLGGFDEDDDDEKLKSKKEPEPVVETQIPDINAETEFSTPRPPVYVPWMETDFKERVPLDE